MIPILVPGSKTLTTRSQTLPSSTRILLLRHAETAEPDRFHGAESDIGLGERGREQAEALAHSLAALAPEAIYTSAMRRALETAGPVARVCGLEPRIIPTLHERRMGPISGRLKAEEMDTYNHAKKRWMAGDLDHTHPGGESYADIRRRAVPALTTIAAGHPGDTIVVVVHGVLIRVVLTSLLEGYGPEQFDRIAIPNAGVNDLRIDGGRWRAVRLAGES